MLTITNAEFKYEKDGDHFTLTHASGNPGYTMYNQYWINVDLSNGTAARIYLKNDFREIFYRKRITSERIKQIEDFIKSQAQHLIGINVNTQTREFIFSRTEDWRNNSRSFDKTPYIGFDDSSLEAIRKVLEKGLRDIVNN